MSPATVGRAVTALAFLALAPTMVGAQQIQGLDDRVGWYRMPAGDTALVTYSARGGLRIFSLWDSLWVATLVPGADGELHHEAPDGPPVAFRELDGAGIEFRWPPDDPEWAHRLSEHGYGVDTLSVEVEGARLRGSLFLPADREGPVPGAVMIHGSGSSDRDNYWYMMIADALVRSGVAVLLPDKRGSGLSGGEWFTTGLLGFATDAAAQLQALRAHPAVDSARVGLVGLSQGGRVAPMAAPATDPAFVVAISGAAVPLDEQLAHELRNDLRDDGMPSFLDPLIHRVSLWRVRRQRPGWWEVNGPLDPLDAWARVTAPSLVLYGREDEDDNVPVARSVARLDSLGAPNIEVRVFDDTGHALFAPGTSRILPAALDTLRAFVGRAVGREDGGRALVGSGSPGRGSP